MDSQRRNRLAAIALSQGMVDPGGVAEFLEPMLAQSGVEDWLEFFVEKGLLNREQVKRLENAYAASEPEGELGAPADASPPRESEVSEPAPDRPQDAPESTSEPLAEEAGSPTGATSAGAAPTPNYEDWMQEPDTLFGDDEDLAPTEVTAVAARAIVAEAGRRAGVLLPGSEAPPGGTPAFPSERKFTLHREVGRGGVARVFEAFDHDIGRKVAVKILKDPVRSTPRMLEKLIEEAQITGQLEHPNIVPVHDLGLLPTGEVFFAMKLVRGRSLAEILRRIRAGNVSTTRTFSRVRLLTLFQQVCMALAFAHDRGVIHRDLKPENILIGDHGEVYSMDWGLAKVMGRSDRPSSEDSVRTLRSVVGSRTVMGTISGTPSYMPPEQAMGNVFELDARSDIYSLGAILYEILTLRPPFTGRDAADTLARVVTDAVLPPSQRAPDRDVPLELEEICLKAMAKRKEARYGSARQLHDEIEAFLEGTRVRRRKRREAGERFRAGQAAVDRYRSAQLELGRHETAAREAARKAKPWAEAAAKQRLWELQETVEETRVRVAEAFADAVEAFSQALGIDASAQEPRDALADLYYERLSRSEAAGNAGDALYFRTMLGHFAGGRYAERLAREGRLRIVSRPAGARATLYSYREENGCLTPADARDLGEAPTAEISVPAGSYLVVLRREGFEDTRVPVVVHRDDVHEVKVTLRHRGELGEGFVYVPGGSYLSGGDPLAPFPEEHHRVHVRSFAIARFPVTCGEYLEFLNDVHRKDPEEARRRAPRATSTGGFYWSARPDVGFTLDTQDPDGDRWESTWPVVGVSWYDAMAYCTWYSGRVDFTVRLPTSAEWEKAARAADGRIFPWGNRFDPTFCKMEWSREGRALPEPVGSFPSDESPYGVRDLAGTVQEWTASRYSEGAALRAVRGGSYRDSHLLCRATWISGAAPAAVRVTYGFRLTRSL